ncbi:MAG: hypothetical protein IPQ10_01050 [Saprospiraceae bacterium]|jgi:hypothetical protein|nr:hypothetical protein [Saprospiraceae bacterium]MBK7796952.1 hypothetical protein [Saprospiraceae bacterium]MBK8152250.1 hypothetical protein [Saprospiraceae bacterium]MBK9377580.1 hypothetical protein [Saprospiraceae bacterium]MBL0259656.1 hypothetical protein [Saprospiraceae bacterium]
MNLPFDRKVFDKSFVYAIMLALVGWVIIYIIWGEFTTADIIGMLFAVPILTYLIHMLMLFNKD